MVETVEFKLEPEHHVKNEEDDPSELMACKQEDEDTEEDGEEIVQNEIGIDLWECHGKHFIHFCIPADDWLLSTFKFRVYYLVKAMLTINEMMPNQFCLFRHA